MPQFVERSLSFVPHRRRQVAVGFGCRWALSSPPRASGGQVGIEVEQVEDAADGVVDQVVDRFGLAV
jgi:hypothetical protein